MINSTTGFEGPEKRLEVVFKTTSTSKSLRSFGAEEWQKVLDHAKCTIISEISNEHVKAYVLSESSLFVYNDRVLIKTCGTIVLLKCLSSILELADTCCLNAEFLCYSRKNFNFPSKQLYPHDSYENEIKYLSEFFPEGKAFTFGSINEDNWNLFIADKRENHDKSMITLEVMMSNLDRDKMKLFYKTDCTAKETTEKSGISSLVPNSINDEIQFEPCGYSLNGLNEDSYYTIHITPEENFSYVSFETNLKLSDYSSLVKNVINTFKPGKFSVALYGNYACSKLDSISSFNLKYKATQKYADFKSVFNTYTMKVKDTASSQLAA